MNRSEILAFLGPCWDRTGALMKDALSSDINLLNTTNETILSHSGKMLRPMLALLMAGACGQVNDDSCRYAAAVEILHNATLIHDDVADASMERRGMPTVNATLGSSAAVLVGDFWLAKTMDLLMLNGDCDRRVLKLFSRNLVELAEGEMLQLEKASSGDTDMDAYLRIIFCKTASLFVSSCTVAALSVSAPEAYTDAAEKFARACGMAFQIKDDILDYAGSDSLGKPVGADLREKKITLPLLCALEGSDAEGEIRRMVRELGSHPEYCDVIREHVFRRRGVEKAAAILKSYVDEAENALSVLPDSRSKEYLSELARFIEVRKV